MKREYVVVLDKEGEEYVAWCPDVVDAIARGKTSGVAISKLKEILRDRMKRQNGDDAERESG